MTQWQLPLFPFRMAQCTSVNTALGQGSGLMPLHLRKIACKKLSGGGRMSASAFVTCLGAGCMPFWFLYHQERLLHCLCFPNSYGIHINRMQTDPVHSKSRWLIWVKDTRISGLSKNETSETLSILLPSEDQNCWLNSSRSFSVFTVIRYQSECSLVLF